MRSRFSKFLRHELTQYLCNACFYTELIFIRRSTQVRDHACAKHAISAKSAQKSNLITHQQPTKVRVSLSRQARHTGVRPYWSNACGKSFKQQGRIYNAWGDTFSRGFPRKSHLISHQIIHTGVSSYVCSTCSRGFSRNAHTRVRGHVCETLCRSFCTKVNQATHTGERPQGCHMRNKGLTRKPHLISHQYLARGTRMSKISKFLTQLFTQQQEYMSFVSQNKHERKMKNQDQDD